MKVESNHCYKSKDDIDHALAIRLANLCNHYLQSIINTVDTKQIPRFYPYFGRKTEGKIWQKPK